MNVERMASHGLQMLVDAPVWVAFLGKITAVLLAAWAIHLALLHFNPRWRVLLWRVTAVGLVALPAVVWFLPALEIRVEPRPVEELAAVSPAVPSPGEAASESEANGFWSDPSREPAADVTPTGAGSPSRPEVPLGNALSGTSATRHTEQSFGAGSPAELGNGSPWQGMLLAVWFAGMGILVFRWSIGHYRVRQMVRCAEQPPRWVRSECLRVAQAVGCQSGVEVRQSVLLRSPLLCGLRRPVLLLPLRMCEDSYRSDLPAIFAHELTHARSRDLCWNAGLHLVSIVLWFHPLAWRLRKAHLAACELVCDAVSANFVGNVNDYCRTLARVAVESVGSLPAPGIAMARTSAISGRLSVLKKRVFHAPLRRRSVLGFGLAALLSVAVLGALQFALAEPPHTETVAVADKTEAKEGRPATKEGQPGTTANSVPKTALLRVRVVEESGKPLAGTKLKAAFLGQKADYTTDADGRATVVVPSPDGKFLSLIAYPDGYPPVRKWWRNDAGKDLIPAEFTFTYEQGRTIGGVVHDERGKPIPGVKVSLSISSEKYEQANLCLALWDEVFVTDSEGRWHLAHVPGKVERVSVGLEHPDYITDLGQMLSDAQKRRTEDRTAVMVMKKGIPVSGTVTDPEGKPLANATVILGEWYSPKRPSVSTDQTGHYRFASLAPGGTVLTVTCPGMAPGLRSVNVQSPMNPVHFQLEKGNTLRVRVVGKDGKPISGVFVTPDTWRGKRVLCDLDIRGRTDAEGRWAWTWAPKDAVEIDFGLTGHVNYMSIRLLPLAPQEAEHVVTLYPALTISGRVVDAETKQPIPSFRAVRGYRQKGSLENNLFWDRHEMLEGKNGQYELEVTGPSLAYRVRIEADGYQPGISREFKSDEGSVTYDFSLRKGQNLNVMVRLADGKPAAGADVCLCPEQSGQFINTALFVKNGRFAYQDSTRPHLKAGADGRLSIQPQENEFLLVVLHDQGYAQTTSKDLIANPEITLKAWARLEGAVRSGGKPVAGLKLFAHEDNPGGQRWAFLNHDDQAETDAEGRFAFPKLKPGAWRITGAYGFPGYGRVDLAPGQTFQMNVGGTAGR